MTGPATQPHFDLAKTIAFLCLALLALTGCATANVGIARSNAEVTAAFNAFQVLPDHNYYSFGSENRPRALIGIQKQYTLDTTLWRAFDATEEALRTRVQNMNRTNSPFFRGYDLIDREGNQIGVWFSHEQFGRRAAFERRENNTVAVTPPREQDDFRRKDFGLP